MLEDIAAGLNYSAFTSVQLVQAYLRRTGEVKKDFNVVLEANPDAEQLAADLDKERSERGPRGYIPSNSKHSQARADQSFAL
jgi:amidase